MELYLQGAEQNNKQSRIVSPVKLSFKAQGEIKIFQT